MNKPFILIPILIIAMASFAGASPIGLDLNVEAGFVGIIKHEIQSGIDSDRGDVFNFVTQGRQDILFPTTRFTADLSLFHRHHVVLLYQPLIVETQAPIEGNFRYDQVDYTPADGFLDMKYGFSFWRISYLFDIIEPPGFNLSAGLSLQIRNANIVFQSSENGKGSVGNDIGPVPIIKLRAGYEWEGGVFIEFEGDGFYASNAFLNGASYPFTGYIYDLSLRGGYRLHENASAYANVRFLGGGGEGNGDSGYNYNDLHTFGSSLGLILHL